MFRVEYKRIFWRKLEDFEDEEEAYECMEDQYYFDQKTGVMVTGFIVINKETYYFGADGAMRTGFQTIDKKKYWFFNDGKMAKDMEKKINGKFYVFDKDGVIISTLSTEGGASVVAIDRLAYRTNLSSGLSTPEWEQAYEKAYEIVNPLVGKTRDEQIKGIVAEVYSRVGNSVSVQDGFPHSNDPYGFFVDGTANSVGISKAVGLCLNMLGIGYETVTGGWNDSTWLRVKIGNDYYVVDGLYNCYEKEKKPYQHPYL